jgi:hypothetical protein
MSASFVCFIVCLYLMYRLLTRAVLNMLSLVYYKRGLLCPLYKIINMPTIIKASKIMYLL